MIDNVTAHDVFLLVIGLERLRDDNTREAKRYRAIGPHFEDQARECEVESAAAEELRWRLKEIPEYAATRGEP